MAMPGKLVIISGEAKGLSCTIGNGGEVTIGRNPDCNLAVPDLKLSRIHCVVRNTDNHFDVLDNNSTNGIYLNNTLIQVTALMKDGDIIRVGDTEIRFSCTP